MSDKFPILGTLETIPWSVLAPHEARAQKNHSQSLQRLAERGGLSWTEALFILTGQTPTFKTDPMARDKVLEICKRELKNDNLDDKSG